MKSVTVTAVDGGAAPTEVLIGRTITLKATAVYGDDSQVETPTVEWASSQPDVATVADGVVTGKTAGSTIITATVDGVTSPDLTVTVAPVPVETVRITSTVNQGVEGSDVTLTAEVAPDDATDKTLTWESSNTEVAAFTKTGAPAGGKILTLLKKGETTVTVHAGDQSATLDFTVLGLDALTVTATARQGGQTLAVTEAIGADLQRRYRITNADAKPTVAYDTVCATADGWLAWPENGEVSGTEGQVATVVDVTVKGANARGKGEATLPAPLA